MIDAVSIAKAVIATVPVAIILVGSEYLWRRKVVQGERARKFIHILAGSYMAFWPFYISFESTYLLGAASVLILVYSKALASILPAMHRAAKNNQFASRAVNVLEYAGVFHAIYAVNRRTYGDIFLGMAVMIAALLTDKPWLFATAILMISLADGCAAVVGRYWGLDNVYYVFGWKVLRKSRAGTAAFIGAAYCVLAFGWLAGGQDVLGGQLWNTLLFIPVGAALLENISPFGTDNVITPVFVILMIQ